MVRDTGVRERQPQRRDTPKAGGLGGQTPQLLGCRGLLKKRCEAVPGHSRNRGLRGCSKNAPVNSVSASAADMRWLGQHVDIHTVKTHDRPANALLIRPDAHIAWAATIDEPADNSAPALREAPSGWFGTP
ncbi:hypothetical protein [Streptomyces chattanoogensis]|uniref:aromatic-ring hydroxylase C-terminal domain-containing protein n=1 Tax=Streptomyces chattanoogensis TaxID=66876 RepID=UPI0036753A40